VITFALRFAVTRDFACDFVERAIRPLYP
jgi:hypothetical protein